MNYRGTQLRRAARILCLVILTAELAISASAQLEIGSNTKLSLNGSTGFSYNGTNGNYMQSGHGVGLLFDFNGNGYYFNPNFLSFNFHPYYNRTQTNSDSQTLSQGSGVGGSVNLFGGSRFPGSISFGKDFGGSSNFRVAGVPTVTTGSSAQNFAVTWSALLPKWPQLTASFSKGSADATFEDIAHSSTSNTTLNLTAGYLIGGWNIQSGMSRNNSSFDTPAYLTGSAYKGNSSGTSYNASTGHSLPLHGGFSVGWGHATTESSAGYSYGTTSYTASNTFSPFHRFSIFQSANYVTNLSGMVLQSLGSTVALEPTKLDFNSNGFSYNTGASYYLGHGVSVGGYYNHHVQNFEKQSYSASQYGGNVNFTRSSRLFGFLNFGIGVADTAGVNGNNGASLNTSVGANRRFGKWETAADFNYAQNIITLGTIATTSNYSYGGSVRRRVSRELSFGGAYRSAHSGLVSQAGDGNVSDSFNGQLQWNKITIGAGHSQSHGTAVLNTSGALVPTQPGGVIVADLLLFNARSYNASASTTLFRRINVSGGYSWFTSDTQSSLSGAVNSGASYNARVQYRVRKFQVGGAYSHSQQATSTLAGGPRMVNSFYLSLSRWFNVF